MPLSKSLTRGGGTGPKIPRFLEPVTQFTNYLNYLYSNIYQNIPIFKHHVPPGPLLIYLWSPRLSYKYDTNMTQISYMKYAIRDHAGLPSIGLEKIYCYVPCKCAFYRLILSLNSNVFSPSDWQTFDNLNSTRPSPARPNYWRITISAEKPVKMCRNESR